MMWRLKLKSHLYMDIFGPAFVLTLWVCACVHACICVWWCAAVQLYLLIKWLSCGPIRRLLFGFLNTFALNLIHFGNSPSGFLFVSILYWSNLFAGGFWRLRIWIYLSTSIILVSVYFISFSLIRLEKYAAIKDFLCLFVLLLVFGGFGRQLFGKPNKTCV